MQTRIVIESLYIFYYIVCSVSSHRFFSLHARVCEQENGIKSQAIGTEWIFNSLREPCAIHLTD